MFELVCGKTGFVTIQINTALKHVAVCLFVTKCFVTIQINTALKLLKHTKKRKNCFVTIQINTALKP